MDIAILVGAAILVALNLLFAWRAYTSRLRLSFSRRYHWLMASLIFGPIGYYTVQGFLPSELFCEE
ncbi:MULTISPECIES: hypothetical protein [Shewanella]|jgi:hypothetical protein|uniref:hypothetical protein n=1 Tax=Shewanella TaxID=22 RepID=UPI001677ABD6|nr:hypothetical protein [Shewanella fodinae]MCL2905121.1 hypothetical protein [Shewanella fodinae]GGY88411.1 hypothetical protein GCM10007169_02030 [Shewanella fodinae]